jgi:hypothetical protein
MAVKDTTAASFLALPYLTFPITWRYKLHSWNKVEVFVDVHVRVLNQSPPVSDLVQLSGARKRQKLGFCAAAYICVCVCVLWRNNRETPKICAACADRHLFQRAPQGKDNPNPVLAQWKQLHLLRVFLWVRTTFTYIYICTYPLNILIILR